MARALKALLDRLRTPMVVPVTPFTLNRNEVHYPVLEQHFQRLIAANVTSFLPAAGSSNFAGLSDDERVAIIKLLRDQSRDILITAPLPFEEKLALELAERMIQEAGANIVLLMPPTGPYLSDPMLYEVAARVLDLGYPTGIYAKDGVFPSDNTIARLADRENFVLVKHAFGDMPRCRHLVNALAGRVAVLDGAAERTAPFKALAGAISFTSGAANVIPHIVLAFYKALYSGDQANMWRYWDLIVQIENDRALMGDSFNISTLCYGLSYCGTNGRYGKGYGLDMGPARRPHQRDLTGADKSRIDAFLPAILEVEAELARLANEEPQST